MRTLVTKEKRIEEITLDNIKNGEVTLMQLNFHKLLKNPWIYLNI